MNEDMVLLTIDEIWEMALIDARSGDHDCNEHLGESSYATDAGCLICHDRYYEFLEAHPEIEIRRG